MEPIQFTDKNTVLQWIEAHKIHHIVVGLFDLDGIFRGKRIAVDKFKSALKDGFGFCNCILGWDMTDTLYKNCDYTGWHTGYPDLPIRLCPETTRSYPFEPNGLICLGEFGKDAARFCPRQLLKQLLARAKSQGLQFRAGFEYEFFLFEESPHSAKDKHYQNLTPLSPGNFGYSILRGSVHAEFHNALLELCEQMNFPLEGLHTETGPGVLEAAITVDEAAHAADKAALFKTFTKVLAQKHDMLATFMARWSTEYAGQSGHIHLSAQDLNGTPLFFDPKQPHQISELMQHFIAGLQAYMPQFAALFAPTVNSYARLVEGFWAPTRATWGVENRTCALRAITGSPESQRIEFRAAGADCNPYLGLLAAIGAGLLGIEQRLKPSDPIQGNGYQDTTAAPLPRHLWEAQAAFEQSELAHELFGTDFVKHFSHSRQWEVLEANKAVSDWALNRYLEII